MPIGAIVSQPGANSIHSAYRPIVIRVSASTSVAPAPPVVYCDIYINDSFYKTLSKTQYSSKGLNNSEWEFDIQDAVQEFCRKYIEDNGNLHILEIPLISVMVYCKFRASAFDPDGFIIAELPIPVQGTLETPPIAGGGVQTNTFYGVNATLQHEDNQNLAQHLASFRTGVWDAQTYPLTHRTGNYHICKNDSDSFGILTNKLPTKLVLAYTTRANISGEVGGDVPCMAVGFVGTPALPPGENGTPYSYSFGITGTAPFDLTINAKPAWLNIAIVNGRVEFNGTPVGVDPNTAQDVDISIDNCANTPLSFIGSFAISDPIAACVPVTAPAPQLADGTVGTLYAQIVQLTGTGPFNLIINSKPSWLSITLVGDTIELTGTPSSAFVGTAQIVDLRITNACGAINYVASFNVLGTQRNITVINNAGVFNTIILQNSLGRFTLPSMRATQIPYDPNVPAILIVQMGGTRDFNFYDTWPNIMETIVNRVQGNQVIPNNPNAVNFILIDN